MATTQLSPTGTPGKRYSFSAKAEAIPEAGPHTGLFTALSASATPGQIHSFSAKDAAAPPAEGPHTGLFTWLSVLGTPGQRHSFLAKTEAEVVAAAAEVPGGGADDGMYYGTLARIIKDDNEMLRVLIKAVIEDII